jgi:hypothetical protein
MGPYYGVIMIVYAVEINGIVVSLHKNRIKATERVIDLVNNWGRQAKVAEMKVED